MKRSVLAILFCAGFAAQVQAQPATLGFRPPMPANDSQTQTADSSESPKAFPEILRAPETLVLPAGTIITIEASELLSSKKQHAGDYFIAELQQPLVVDGWVVARPGQTVIGRIAEAKKAGRVKGKSKLSLELQTVSFVDGRQLPVETEMVENNGAASHGRDAAAIAIGTGVGAAVGAICGAKGAAVGAAIGATASIAGVLLTRGEETEIDPEKLLTFRLASPLTVTTEQSPQSFWQVTADDYMMPEKVLAVAPVVVSRPRPRVPLSTWPESQGLATGHAGHSACSD